MPEVRLGRGQKLRQNWTHQRLIRTHDIQRRPEELQARVNPIIEREIHGTKISVIDGDITKLEIDAIVNPANSYLTMGGGAAGAILRAGGNEVQEEALKKAPIAVGKAVATTGGKLRATYVIHAPTMTQPAMATSQENARLATKAALETALRLGIKSIAFPGMGTGIGGLDPQAAADSMVLEIRKHSQANTTLKRVILVGYNPRMTHAFEKAVRNIS